MSTPMIYFGNAQHAVATTMRDIKKNRLKFPERFHSHEREERVSADAPPKVVTIPADAVVPQHLGRIYGVK